MNHPVKIVKPESFPRGDYVSPNFSAINPDDCFPNRILGKPSHSRWFYLRRNIPHNWYVDQRQPDVGFVNRDEAHILYNTALKFRGKPALEIGCWMGWSACHLALGGVKLDVIDPLLSTELFYQSVTESLGSAGVAESVTLIPGHSPEQVEELANQYPRQWSLIFIDGYHEAPAPLQDAQICERFAAADALILFHDLASPDVAQGLDYLKHRGWQTMIYQTAQIMGVAWRGDVEPVHHQPDPDVSWHLPPHLHNHPVSGLASSDKRDGFADVLRAVQPYTFLSKAQLLSLYSKAQQAYHYVRYLPNLRDRAGAGDRG